MDLHRHLNSTKDNTTNSAFDSRNDQVDVWDCCYAAFCNENAAAKKAGRRVDEVETLSNSNVMKQTNSYVADAVKSLHMKERDHALNDIHGVAEIPEEKVDFINEQLQLLDAELEKIKSKRACFIAKAISENYVSNSKFRLKFLRAEAYNAKNAATRIVRHFELKLDIFGKEKLTKDITLHDLTEEDLSYMKTGFFQLFSEKDRSGRAILCSQAVLASDVPVESRRRITWYYYNIASKDEETQLKGVVMIFIGIGLGAYNFESNNKVNQLSGGLPVRYSAIHFCFHSHMPNPIFKFVKAFRNYELGRIRLHYSSILECVYTLMTFGIPRTIFGSDGTIDATLVTDWMNKQIAVEDERIKSRCLLVPNKFDVLLGKGKRSLRSPGNLHLREIMEAYKDEYEASSRSQKVYITRHIFNEIVGRGGRFLHQGNVG